MFLFPKNIDTLRMYSIIISVIKEKSFKFIHERINANRNGGSLIFKDSDRQGERHELYRI